MAIFFCLMAVLGVIALEDQQESIAVPVDGAFSIQGKSASNSQAVYELINKICAEKGVTVYKPVVNKIGQLNYLDMSQPNNKKRYLKTSVIGMYYTSGRLSSTDFDSLKNLDLQIFYKKLPWFLAGFTQFDGSLRIILTISLYMILFVCLLVSESRRLKERVIWRSLGKPIIRFISDCCLPLGVYLCLILGLEVVYIYFRGGGMYTYSSQTFLAILLTNLFIFQVIEMLILFLAYLMIKLEQPVEIIKNKLKGGSLFLIWLGMIAALIFVSGKVLKETSSTQQRLKEQLVNLKPWHQVKTWQKLEPIGIDPIAQEGEVTDYRASEKIYSEILATVRDKAFLYLDDSGAYVPEGAIDGGFTAELKRDGVSQPEVNRRLVYINQIGVNLENTVNQTVYQAVKGKVATICLPERYQKAQDSVLNTVLREQFIATSVNKEDIAVQVIPNGQKLFYFNESGENQKPLNMISRLASRASDTDVVLVVLDLKLLSEEKNWDFATNVVNNGLFSPEAVGEIAALSHKSDFAINPVTPYQAVVLKIQSLKHQLDLANVLQNMIFAILFISVYQYAMTLMSMKQSEFVKRIILGRSKLMMLTVSLSSLFLVVVASVSLTVAMTGRLELLYLIIVLALITGIASIKSCLQMSRRYTEILKGDVA